jgi:hypothetical protein
MRSRIVMPGCPAPGPMKRGEPAGWPWFRPRIHGSHGLSPGVSEAGNPGHPAVGLEARILRATRIIFFII